MTIYQKWIFLLILLGGLIFSAAAWADLPFFTRFSSALDRKVWQKSDGWVNGNHQSCEWRGDAAEIRAGRLTLVLSKRPGKLRPFSCGEIQTQARFGYGRYEARMRSAVGSGLNTAFFTYIGPPMGVPHHDEIDFEFLGKNPRAVEIAHWVSGVKIASHVVDLKFDSSRTYHDYAFDWSPHSIRWYVDGNLVHETLPDEPIPKNPGKIFFSLWSGSPEWMGSFTYDKPVRADILWVKYTPMPVEGKK